MTRQGNCSSAVSHYMMPASNGGNVTWNSSMIDTRARQSYTPVSQQPQLYWILILKERSNNMLLINLAVQMQGYEKVLFAVHQLNNALRLLHYAVYT